MQDLENLLPRDVTSQVLTLRSDNFAPRSELVLPYSEALRAIEIASENEIAILGVEAYELEGEALRTINLVDPSSRIRFTGDWGAYVAALNTEAEGWIKEHRLGEERGYILTSASHREYNELDSKP